MKRRQFIKTVVAAASTPLLLKYDLGLSSEDSQTSNHREQPDVYLDYYEKIQKLNTDLAATYFKPNLDESKLYDVVIIGSGMGGGILADATSDAGLKTLVLEAGNLRHFTHVSNLPIGGGIEVITPYKKAEGSSVYGALSFCLGGKSIFWSNVIPRMQKWELRYWPKEVSDYLKASGYDNSEMLFRKRSQYSDQQNALKNYFADEFKDFTVSHLPRAYHTPTQNSRKGFPDERSTGSFSTAALLTASRASSGKAGSDNLTINLKQIVTHIETKGKIAVAVHCYDPIEKITRIFRGRSIILSAGTLESARIALSSNLKDRSGKLGVGATFHQSAEMQFTVPDSFKLLSRYDQAKLFLHPNIQDENDGYTCELALNWQFWDAKTEDDDIWKQKYGNPNESRSTIKFLFRHNLNDRNYIRVKGNTCEVFIDPLSGEPHKQEIYALKKRIMEHFGAKMEDVDGKITYHQSGDAVWHIAGSLRMDDLGRGVVDSNLKFHEYENLYACDLSVFPDIPSANPSLTLGALALRLSENLKER